MRRKFNTIIKNVKKALPHKGIAHLTVDIIIHKLIINTDPRDYFKFKFYKKGKSFKEKSRYVSLLGSRYFPHGNNPLKFNAIFTNKYIQKEILHYLDLPTAEMITTIGKNFEISNKYQMNNFLNSLDIDFVIKPISGTHGKDILSLTKKDDSFYCGSIPYTKDMIWNHISSGFEKGYIVEEKICNNESLCTLNSSCLNTFRIIMIKTEDEKWHNACSFLKLGKGGNQVDNLKAGGIFVDINCDGKTLCAYDYKRMKQLKKHPDTLCDLVGIELKGFEEVLKLAFDASEKLNFMGSIGWDIALTENGPVIIEVNAWWGEPQTCLGRGIINEVIANGLKKRNIFSLWDKTKMYPNFYKKSIF